MALPTCKEAVTCNFQPQGVAILRKIEVLLLKKTAIWVLNGKPAVHTALNN